MASEWIELLDDLASMLRDEQRTYSTNDPMFVYYSNQISAIEDLENIIFNHPNDDLDDIVYARMLMIDHHMREAKTDIEKELYMNMYEVLDEIYANATEVW